MKHQTQLLNSRAIIQYINNARIKNQLGMLPQSVKNTTKPEFWITPVKSSIINKQKLIQLAKDNQPRPNKKHQLGQVLCEYTSNKKKSFDPIFTQQIKSIRPNWFISQSDIANKKKQQLLKLAKNPNQPRPPVRAHTLGLPLFNYTNPKNKCFDPIFTKQIKSIRPDWFISQSTIANQKKQQLIKMAKSNQPRPTRKHPLGHVLKNYLRKDISGSDPAFAKQIKKLAPHWFTSQSTIANQKKQTLLHMAKQKKPRPTANTYPPLNTFKHYVNPNSNSFDPVFTKQIKSLAPHWFIK